MGSDRRRSFVYLALSGLMGAGTTSPAPAPARAAESSESPASAAAEPTRDVGTVGDSARGMRSYRRLCATCHGAEGDGRGPTAVHLEPRPRDFTTGVYALRSTAAGTPPTDADLFRTITVGIPGTGMPGWGGLPAAERWDLVAAIESFSPRFQQPREPVEVPDPPPFTPALVQRGRELYDGQQCVLCHGESGRGDGPVARALRDDRGRRTLPSDLSRAATMKSGVDERLLYLTVAHGRDGTHMAGFGQILAADDLWALVAYVRTLSSPASGGSP